MEGLTTVAIVSVVLVLGGIFLIILRRVMRVALKLAAAMALILMLMVGAGIGWWQGWFSSSSSARRPSVPTNQRTNTNRRPPAR